MYIKLLKAKNSYQKIKIFYNKILKIYVKKK